MRLCKVTMEFPIIKLNPPYTMVVSGMTGCGKTHFVSRLVRQQAEMHEKPFEKIIWAYSMMQPVYREMSSQVEFVEGFPSDFFEILEKQQNQLNTLLILDDLMFDLDNDTRIAKLFTMMRHQHVSTIFIVQNFFAQSKCLRTVTRNSQYIVLFPNLRDVGMIATLGRQMFPDKKNFLQSAFADATATRYGYLFVDLKPETDRKLVVRTKIFPGEVGIVYQPR